MEGKQIKNKIRNLLKKDYPYQSLQELIAEIIIRTSDNHSDSIHTRYDKAIKVILGEPSIPKKRGKDDEEYLYLIAAHVHNNGIEKAWSTCEEYAHYIHIKDYIPFKTKRPRKPKEERIKGQSIEDDDQLTAFQEREIKTTTQRLSDKLKDNLQYYLDNYHSYFVGQNIKDEDFLADEIFSKRLFKLWRDKYQ